MKSRFLGLVALMAVAAPAVMATAAPQEKKDEQIGTTENPMTMGEAACHAAFVYSKLPNGCMNLPKICAKPPMQRGTLGPTDAVCAKVPIACSTPLADEAAVCAIM